jgi:uncharacterized protein (DUF885 family)
VWSVADGPEIYTLLARQHTTTELTPAELHQFGLEDLEAIHREMRAIMVGRGCRRVHPRLHRAVDPRSSQLAGQS